MDKETAKIFKELMYYSSIGLQVALSIFLGLFIGIFLDSITGASPCFTFIFLGLGIGAAFRNILILMKKSQNT